ncbi:MAG: FGGY family carbohydrate kinase [Herbiconiux sp.]|nr:FGGY family carbohydrate kinase [Herbiconiux sp.]
MTSHPSVVLGVDIGTYEAKGVLVDAAGTVIAQQRRPHRVTVPAPGQVEHDAITVWWDGFVEITRGLLAASGLPGTAVKSVAVSGIGPCVLPVDSDGNPLRNAILYGVDTRAVDQIARLEDSIGMSAIRRRSGTNLSSQSAGPKIMWIEDNEPEVFAATERFVTCQTFIVGRLTDVWKIDHATGAYYHPFYDRQTAQWDLEGMPTRLCAEQLPALGWSSDVAGYVTREAAAATGLATGTSVLVGAPDAAVEALSAGVAQAGEMMLMYGSSHFIIEIVDEPHSSEKLWPAPFLFPDTHLVAAGTATAGSFTRWFADLLVSTGTTDDAYTALTADAASSPPGANGLLSLPYLSGERTPIYDPAARGALVGLRLDHTRGDVARAIAEGIAQSAAAAVLQYDRENLRPTRIHAVGGGTKNRVWTQAVTDILGRQQEIVSTLGACFGDAMLAAMAVNLVDRDAALGWVQPSATMTPRPELRSLYDIQREAFQQLYEQTRSVLEKLGTIGTLGVTVEEESAE